jgi:glc operon protein GlcG
MARKPIPQWQFPAYAFCGALATRSGTDSGARRRMMGGSLMRNLVVTSLAVCASLALGAAAWAQQPAAPAAPAGPPQYGSPGVTLEQARKAVEAAEAEAKKNGWLLAIAVVSNGGYLVHFSKMDNTQLASVQIAIHKAKAAATFRRPTKAFQDALQQTPPNLVILTLDGVIASEGGIPLMAGGKIIGAIGCSGATGAQDGQACKAGADTIK